jgi:hypothetical protein
LDLAQVRSRREEGNNVEMELSYLRRMIQGRLDIVIDERDRRIQGKGGSDVASLVERLPGILADRVHAPGLGRLPTFMAPAELGPEATARLDAIAPADRMVEIPGLPDRELNSLVEALGALEADVSAQRRKLHDVLLVMQEELIRRYRSGEANVDSLLK